MSALDKLMESTLARDTAAPSKPIRLVADPNISVDQIQKVFKEYLESADAWRLEVAPNSKLQSSKVVKALQNLYKARDLQLPMLGGHHLTTASDKMDRLDFAVS